jgi:MFS family permease
LTAQVGEATPQAARGEVFGWYSGASYVGLTVSPWMAGALRDATGNPAAPIYLAAAVLALLLPAYAWFCREAGRLNNSPTAPA